MNSPEPNANFTIWGIDHAPYGPIELPTLVNWVKDERVTAETWIFREQTEHWQRAAEVPELQLFFRSKPTVIPDINAPSRPNLGIKPGALRRVKVLANLTDDQIERFASFMEIEKVPQWAVVVKQGEHGDAMYLILEGELRVRMVNAGKETILATLSVGEFFGDISMLDRGPRSADVVANTDATLLKMSSPAFERLAKEAPELAAPVLFAIGKTLSARIRADNKRLGDSVKFTRATGM